MHSKAVNVIGEKGICYWGVYHSWNKIKSYEITENILKLKFEGKLLRKDYTSEMILFFDIKEKDNISDFLISKINN
jgi:hypothetical protein